MKKSFNLIQIGYLVIIGKVDVFLDSIKIKSSQKTQSTGSYDSEIFYFVHLESKKSTTIIFSRFQGLVQLGGLVLGYLRKLAKILTIPDN